MRGIPRRLREWLPTGSGALARILAGRRLRRRGATVAIASRSGIGAFLFTLFFLLLRNGMLNGTRLSKNANFADPGILEAPERSTSQRRARRACSRSLGMVSAEEARPLDRRHSFPSRRPPSAIRSAPIIFMIEPGRRKRLAAGPTNTYCRVARHLSLPGNDDDPARLEVGASEHEAPSNLAELRIDRIELGARPTGPLDPGGNGRQLKASP